MKIQQYLTYEKQQYHLYTVMRASTLVAIVFPSSPNCVMLPSDILASYPSTHLLVSLLGPQCVVSLLHPNVSFSLPKHRHSQAYKASCCCPFVNRLIAPTFCHVFLRWQHQGEPLQVRLHYSFGACLTKGFSFKRSILPAWPTPYLKSPEAECC
jgi:hypothetical protein